MYGIFHFAQACTAAVIYTRYQVYGWMYQGSMRTRMPGATAQTGGRWKRRNRKKKSDFSANRSNDLLYYMLRQCAA